MYVKEFKTCPICGHHGWCGVTNSNSNVPNAVTYVCHYVFELDSTVDRGTQITGCDGRIYHVFGVTGESGYSNATGWLLEEDHQRQESYRIWREQNPNSNSVTYDICPVCGKQGCYWFKPSKSKLPDSKIIVCKSITSDNMQPKRKVEGRAGWFRAIKPHKEGYMLQTEEQYQQGIRQWLDSRERRDDETLQGSTETAIKPSANAQQAGNTIVKPIPASVNSNEVYQITETRNMVASLPERVVGNTRLLSAAEVVANAINANAKTRGSEQYLRSNRELDEIYRFFISKLFLLSHHRDKLIEDGWTDELIKRYNVVSMPLPDKERYELEQQCRNGSIRRPETLSLPWRVGLVSEIQKAFGENLLGIPGFYQIEKKDKMSGEVSLQWRIAGPAGMMFFSNDIRGHMFGAQIRLDKKNKRKYIAWSTNPEKTNDDGEQVYLNGTSLPVQAGFIYHPERDQSYVAYITEGHKKGVIGNYYLRCPFVTLPGVGQFNALVNNPDESLNIVRYLKRIGVQIVIVAYDADKEVNKNVLRSEYGVAAMLRDLGFQVQLADWSFVRHKCKGLDDLLTAGLMPNYTDVSWDNVV